MSDRGSLEEVSKVYTERNMAVALAMQLARKAGYLIWVHSGDDPDWPVVFIELPTGQVSWHVPIAELMTFFPDTPVAPASPWDGHSTAEKNARIRAFMAPGWEKKR